ncbi:MAG: tyrosine--tRNA ligase [Planctomycetes bacterium]|nr:tyrosine--tRNA ligase [Planctomycetota bacterium]
MNKTPQEQANTVLRGAVGIHTEEELRSKLHRAAETGRPLRVKLGVDPSAPDIHLGHSVVLRKMRQFQDLGHQAVLIIGDFTALVGDPTGRKKARPQLSPQEVETNARTYLEQVGRILLADRLEIVRNSQWLKPLTFYELITLASRMTVAQFLERDDFSRRYREGTPIFLHEFLYLVMQAYDSVMVKADVELGGTDQTFNLLVGRDLMRDMGMEPQVALTCPILPGLHGGEKMSKSLGNHVGITESAFEMFSKIMSIPDALMKEYYALLTGLPSDEIETMCDSRRTHPRSAKMRLASTIAGSYHPGAEADQAADEWRRRFSEKAVPETAPEISVDPFVEAAGRDLKVRFVKLVAAARGSSASDARRLIVQGGVEVEGRKLTDATHLVPLQELVGKLLKIGKKNEFFRVTTSKYGPDAS